MTYVLETRGLCKSFGGIVATDNVNFKLPAGARASPHQPQLDFSVCVKSARSCVRRFSH